MKGSVNWFVAFWVAVVVLAGCEDDAARPTASAADGQAERGRETLRELGCGACHVIPGVPGANGIVGPPLGRWAERGYIAGVLPNSRENLVRWLLDPPAVKPSTAMPDMGVSEAEARDVAAYLYSRQ